MVVPHPWSPTSQASHGRFDPKSVFTRGYAVIREVLRRHAARPGVALFAFDGRDRPTAQTWLSAGVGEVSKAIIGRHSFCELPLETGDEAMALRHLLVLASAKNEGVLVRMLDLQTGRGFADEQGKPLESVVFDGPAFFAVTGVVIVALPTGNGIPLHDPEEAWAQVPPRFTFDERSSAPELSLGFDAGEELSMIQVRSGPSMAGHVMPGGPRAGRLRVSSDARQYEIPISWQALADGMLLGRYARCGVQMRDHYMRLSRVHLLFVEHEDAVLAIDTGSSNGTWIDDRPISVIHLWEGTKLCAGGLELTWSFED